MDIPPGSWPVWENQAGIVGIAPSNMLDGIPGGDDPTRFFAVVEKDPPPPPALLEEDFDDVVVTEATP